MFALLVADVLRLPWLVFAKPHVAAPSPHDGRWHIAGPGLPPPHAAPPAAQRTGATDEWLMVAHTSGDPGAFAQLYSRYVQPLLRLMARQHRSNDAAHDLVQQTFLQVHRARADFDPSRRFRPWLYAIALNLSREALRKQKRRPTVSNEDPGVPEPVAQGVTPEQRHVAAAVRAAIVALPRDQREVIELHWFDGLTFPEIGLCLRVPTNTAKVRAHRGYQSLRARLGALMS